METISFDSKNFSAEKMDLFGINVLLIKAAKGALGCAYLNLNAAEKFGHALAIVSRVASYEEMLDAEIKATSSAAAALGVTIGMTGREALLKMD